MGPASLDLVPMDEAGALARGHDGIS